MTHLPGLQPHDMAMRGDCRVHNRLQGDRVGEVGQRVVSIDILPCVAVRLVALLVARLPEQR